METLLPLTTLKSDKFVAVPAWSPKMILVCQIIPFILISNFITINCKSYIVYDCICLGNSCHMGVCVCVASSIRLTVTSWTIAH